jgi:Flp pilus assembly protein protease CpaA
LNWDYLILINSSFFAILLGIIDYRTKLLPNKIVFSFLLTNIFLILVSPIFDLNNLIYSISSSLLVFLAYLGIYFISKRTFGLGDVKYSYALSLAPTYLYGFNETINMHLVAFVVGGIF